jgi:hypothetical protein
MNFEAEVNAASPRMPENDELSLDGKIELVMLKFLSHYGSPEKLRADMTERSKADPSWNDCLDSWNRWYERSEQSKANADSVS